MRRMKPSPNVTPSPLRYAGIPAKAIPILRRAEKALADNDIAEVERSLALALTLAPGHPQTLRLLGQSQFRRGFWAESAASFSEALAQAPSDVDLLTGLGQAQAAMGDIDLATATLERAIERDSGTAGLLALGILLDAAGRTEAALAVADRAIARDPACAKARLLRARSLQALGAIDATAAEYRELLRRRQEVPAAWFALLDIKTVRLDATERSLLKRDLDATHWNDSEKALLGFAYARVCEETAEYAAAVGALETANRLIGKRMNWNSSRWSEEVDAIRLACDKVEVSAPADLGREVIFIVGLPRSGTTLIEQILASHPQVEGANELQDLAGVIGAESRRRGRPPAHWMTTATAADWERLGRDYLYRTRTWRASKPIHTDKMPENWIHAGAIRAMLPAARIVDSRRDAAETCWSCYKQLFAPGRVGYSYDIKDLIAYWKDYDRFMRSMAVHHPHRIRVQSYEALVADLEGEARDLLAFCGLDFDPACLAFHEASRSVRTASSAQVRQPIQRRTTMMDRYGEHLREFRGAFEGG